MITKEAINNREMVAIIKHRLGAGVITYDEAVVEATEICDRINAKAKEIAKSLGVRPRFVNPRALLR